MGGMGDMGAMGGMNKGGCGKGCGGMQSGGKGGWGEPMLKKAKTGPVSTGDPAKDALVEKVKAFQRSGDEQKQAWGAFADAQAGAARDPARHDKETLEMFLTGYGVA